MLEDVQCLQEYIFAVVIAKEQLTGGRVLLLPPVVLVTGRRTW
jgi:hypothetical protein